MRLKRATSPEWIRAVLSDFDAFLLDHAACERKASATAMAFVSHYPDRSELVEACVALAIEELGHFREVYRFLAQRGRTLAPDTRNAYIARLKREFREGSREYFLDRLLVAGIAEARGCERFALVAAALPAGELVPFYRELARSEARHQDLYLDLAKTYFDAAEVARRLDELLDVEAAVIESLSNRPALY